jgi:hypothetical protein
VSTLTWYKGVTYNGREWVDSDCGAFIRYTSLSGLLAANRHIFTDDDIAPLMALRDNYPTPHAGGTDA